MKWLSKKALITIAALLIAALLLLFARTGGSKAMRFELLHSGDVIAFGTLEEEHTFSPEGFPDIVIAVKDGKIAFTASDCPDRTCVKTGFIGEAGQVTACLPNGLILRISGAGEIDAVV